MDWKAIAIFTPLLFVTYQTLAKFLPKDTSIFLVNGIASLIGAIIMFLFFLFNPNKSLTINTKAWFLIIAIGLLISIGNYLIIKAYSLGAPQSVFTTIFYPLLILYGVIFGLILWRENLNIIQIGGIVLTLIGTIFIAYFRK